MNILIHFMSTLNDFQYINPPLAHGNIYCPRIIDSLNQDRGGEILNSYIPPDIVWP
jgi:hypothetical protein